MDHMDTVERVDRLVERLRGTRMAYAVEGHGASAPAGGDLIEVRLLGPMQVRRRDGSLVDNRDWRTAKTADLLRLLALGDGQPVPVDTLLEELWPHVDETRGRASLRTAASQLRLVLGTDAVDRHLGGLVLPRVWVDVAVYERLALEAQRLLREGSRAAGVRAALEAEALRLGDVTAHEPGAQWVFQARAVHQVTRMQLLLAASKAALALGWLADAADLAGWARSQDPASEQAARTLMRTYSRLGASERALREFERCRVVLAEELGINPSPQTRALHLQLLSGAVPHEPPPPVLGRRREVDRLLTLVAGTRRTGAPVTVHLSGDSAPERARLVSTVCDSAGAQLLTAPDVASGLAHVPAARAGASDAGSTQVLYVDGAGARGDDPPPAALPQRVVLILGMDQPCHPPAVHAVELQPLLREELHELAVQVLGDRAGPAMLLELEQKAGGSDGAAVATMHQWLREGRVHSSGQGMVLVDGTNPADHTAVRTTLARTIERISALDLEVFSTIAVLDRAVSVDQLMPLLSEPSDGPPGLLLLAAPDRQDLDRTVGHLCDLGLLRRLEGRVALRDQLLVDAVRSWLRPSVLHRLHRSIAERAPVTSADRVGHWLAAGEPELACAAALEAAEIAIEEARHEDARGHVLQVCSLADGHVEVPGASLDLPEQLAEVLRQLDRPDDAQRTLARTVAMAPRIPRQLSRPGQGTGPAAARDLGLEHAGDVPARTAGIARLTPPRAADSPERRGGRAASHLPEALLPLLAQPSGPAPQLGGHLVDLLLGNAVHAEHGLLALRGELSTMADPALTACVDLLLHLAAHDLGRDRPRERWRETTTLAERAGVDWGWVPVRVLAERRDLGAAAAADSRGAATGGSELGSQLHQLARSVLLSEQGRGDEAIATLTRLVQTGVASGATLLLPEVAARLALAQVPRDLGAAMEHFDLFEWSVGAQDARPRASILRLLARAALRSSTGDHRRAAVAAAQAAQLAHASQLVPLAAQAHLDRARYLAADGSSESVTAMALARDAFRIAGIEAPSLIVGVHNEPDREGDDSPRPAAIARRFHAHG